MVVLEPIYDIRSKVERLHSPLSLISGNSVKEKEDLLYRRVRQADSLARFAARHVLGSEALTEAFKTDENIDAFWHEPDGERTKRWGERLDLEAVP
jgi:hypothetical protein